MPHMSRSSNSNCTYDLWMSQLAVRVKFSPHLLSFCRKDSYMR